MQKITKYSLSPEEMKEAVLYWLANKGTNAQEIKSIQAEGFCKNQSFYDIEIIEQKE